MSLNKTVSPVITEQLIAKQTHKNSRKCVLWGSVNLILFGITYHNVSHDYSFCKKHNSYFYWMKVILLLVFFLNTLYHSFKYFTYYWQEKAKRTEFNCPNIKQTLDDSKTSFQNVLKTRYSINTSSPASDPQANNSWFLNCSANDSWNNTFNSFKLDNSKNSFNSSFQPINSSSQAASPVVSSELSKMEISDHQSLQKYLKEFEAVESSQSVGPVEQKTNLLSFFWNHPASKMTKDMKHQFGNVQYQLSSFSGQSLKSAEDAKVSPNRVGINNDTWKKLNVDSVALMQWTENLRIWISQTILSRLVSEFDLIDKSLHHQGLTDISLGRVGLDRLRKTAQGSVLQNTPNLPSAVSFLELSSNQEYLVKRIKELAKGGCMSEYKWNGGGSHGGQSWDSTLPTDAAIIMHLLATYLDTQLLPLPSNPDMKPFSGYHLIRATEKLPELTDAASTKLAIHEVTVHPPHYRVIIGKQSYEMIKGYNNLFHSILLFLYHVNEREHGMLGRINLGRSGLNMLWILSK